MPPKNQYEYFSGKDEGLARNRDSGIIYAIKHFAGMPNLFRSTGETDIRAARKKLPGLIKEHLEKYQDGKRSPEKSKTVGQVIDEVYETQTARPRRNKEPLRKKTIAKRKFYFERIRTDMGLGPLPIGKLTLQIWTGRLDQVMKKLKRKTFWDYAKHMNILERHAYQQQYITNLISFPNPDGAHKEGTVFTTDELKLLFAEMNEDTKDQFVLSYENCLRKLECLHLEWNRIDLETGELILRKEHVKTGSKTGKGRTIFITPHALERLRARWQKVDQADANARRWVFPSETGKGPITDNKTAWNNAKENVLEKFPAFQHWGTWHHLRHTAITYMFAMGMDIAKVSEFVGTSIATLQRVYLHSKAEHTRGVSSGLMINGGK